MIKLSNELNNVFVIIRHKFFDWSKDPYFENVIKTINENKNIILSNKYDESYYSYKLCTHSDLIISKHTSLADECLSHKKPLLFCEYTHNIKKTISKTINFYPSSILCNSYEELAEKSKSFLYDKKSYLFQVIEDLHKKIYHVNNNKMVKSKILEHLESSIQ